MEPIIKCFKILLTSVLTDWPRVEFKFEPIEMKRFNGQNKFEFGI